MQILLEFIDKGGKGLLSGDMSVNLIENIEVNISKMNDKLDTLQENIEDI